MGNKTAPSPIEQLVNLAKTVQVNDTVDWSKINVKEDEAYNMMAKSVIQQMAGVDPDHQNVILMATVTKLLVENLALNLQVQKG